MVFDPLSLIKSHFSSGLFLVFCMGLVLFFLFLNFFIHIFFRQKIQSLKDSINFQLFLHKNILFINQELLSLPRRYIIQEAHTNAFGLNYVHKSIEFFNNKFLQKSVEEIYSLKDYISEMKESKYSYVLNPKFHSICELKKILKKELLLVGCSNIAFDIKNFNSSKIRCDLVFVCKIIYWFAKEFYKIKRDSNPGESVDVVLTFSSSKISYTRDLELSADNSNILRSDDAVCITFSEDSFSLKLANFIKPSYVKSLSELKYTAQSNRSFQDIVNGLEAHYGLYEIFEESFVWNCIIPVDVYNVRPNLLDLSEPPSVFYNYPPADDLEHKFLFTLRKDFPQLPLAKICKAIEVIKIYHAHQKRHSGEPYYIHPLSVALNLLRLIKVESSDIISFLKDKIEVLLLGGLLHDLLEDTVYTDRAILSNFGHEVFRVVCDVTKINKRSIAILMTNIEEYQYLIEKNPVSLSVKLIDRYHNLSTINGHKTVEKRRLVAQETLGFFIVPADYYGFTKLSALIKKMCKEILKKGSLDGKKFVY